MARIRVKDPSSRSETQETGPEKRGEHNDRQTTSQEPVLSAGLLHGNSAAGDALFANGDLSTCFLPSMARVTKAINSQMTAAHFVRTPTSIL